MDPLRVDDKVTIPSSELHWTAARAGGPGGQNVNKVSTKVELRFDLPGTRALDEAAKQRLRAIAGARLDASGWILVTSQRTRDQPKNLDDARAKLAALIARALEVPKARRPTKPSRGVKERRLRDKAHDSAKKRERKPARDD